MTQIFYWILTLGHPYSSATQLSKIISELFLYINTTSTCLFFSCILAIKGSSASIQTEEVCYGSRWQFPSNYPYLTVDRYTSIKVKGSVKVVIKDGKVSSFRFYVTIIDLEYDTFKASV